MMMRIASMYRLKNESRKKEERIVCYILTHVMLRFLARWTNIHILLNNFDVNFVSCSLLKQTKV